MALVRVFVRSDMVSTLKSLVDLDMCVPESAIFSKQLNKNLKIMYIELNHESRSQNSVMFNLCVLFSVFLPSRLTMKNICPIRSFLI